ncbi:hypothetical protein DGG96_16785 [Legionella qingyii]|uniref:Uncharacterized protein n=1 Tax=Legionella qingyii TaxID=2184757 RepID=A0A317TYC5_9GAMM|nr:hypothetical protein DGG96_16785 [Legionella qingyii]
MEPDVLCIFQVDLVWSVVVFVELRINIGKHEVVLSSEQRYNEEAVLNWFLVIKRYKDGNGTVDLCQRTLMRLVGVLGHP